MPTASDVPGKFDVVINSQGYILSNTVEESLPFRTQRALYTSTPTFLERTNVGPSYGDDQQAFFQTVSQNDWAGGEQQRYFRKNDDAASASRFYRGTNIDTRVAGQVTQAQATTTATFAASVTLPIQRVNGISVFSTTRMYDVDFTGTITDQGVHGLGAIPTSSTGDGAYIFISTEAGGTVGVRRWGGASWSTFSATAATELAYLNNTLYGFVAATSKIVSYDTAGTSTDVHLWKEPAGSSRSILYAKLQPWGGKLIVLLGTPDGPELWQYDGSAFAIVAKYPANFYGVRMCVSNGIVFVAGTITRKDNNVTRYEYPAIYYYDPNASSATGLLWKSSDAATVTTATAAGIRTPAISAHENGLLFTDDSMSAICYFNLAESSVTSVGAYTPTVGGSSNLPYMAASPKFSLTTFGQADAFLYPNGASTATSSTVVSSLYDFDSSLTKQFRGVIVDWIAATDGNGGTVDIAYCADAVDGTFTSLQTGAASGTEYTLSNVSGRGISIKVTLNKGTSTAGPTLKRVYVRAAPVLSTYKLRTYVFDLSGRDGKTMVRLRDGTDHTLDGMDMAANLNTAAATTAPFSITDRFGTFTGIVQADQLELLEVRPEEFLAKVQVRQV